jgi:hypothetical protein
VASCIHVGSGEEHMGKTAKKKRARGLEVQRDNEMEMRVIKTAINKQFENIKQLDLSILNDVSAKNPG